jgi:hypothetical protein
MIELSVGDEIKVRWSNGAGYSVYCVRDSDDEGPHRLEPVDHFEYIGDGVKRLEL